ncbi:N-terminal EF-hand calcium-binding protein 3 isoform X1 [Piliocolobus tephrosceles]|uniref:N-terminal EF-hand calcium-binding protein 3 isoform X1 n=1 Tax=Piliocolobus tephrosceles TaxID=591936 RepID=UPI000C2AC122|nr:N-terminal EF-hand calcium-binding protein 3 isoform X1 [Piliocolobus tephrosceles]
MACVGLLTVCLLRPPAPQPQPQPQPPRHPQLAPDPGPAGHALFQDVFRRADKNDDGKLSFEEFQNYFADGVLSPGELQELFSGIDGHLTDNLETEKLCDYFAEHLGVYRPVLAALESLNRAVLAAMDATKLEYERASKVDQFVTRFLLRETVSQLQALQSSLEGASDTLEAQARGWRYVRALLTCRASAQAPTVPPFQIPTVLASWSLYFWAGKPRWGEMRLALALGLGVPGGLFPHPGLSRPGVPVLGPVSLTFSRSDAESTEAQSRPCGSRRTGRRALRSVSRSSTWSPGSSDTGRSSEAEMQWQLQVNRLQELIDQLECKAPRLEPLHEEDLAKGPDSHILVAQRQVQVAEEGLQDFHRALRCYVDFTGAQSHCLHVSAQKMPDGASLTLCEFWQDEASWRRHQQTPCSKAFQRVLIDHLRAPDTLTTVFFPASWWIMNNN